MSERAQKRDLSMDSLSQIWYEIPLEHCVDFL